MSSVDIGNACINMLMKIVSAGLTWFTAIINATGLRSFWTSVVILVAFMSIVLVPMRSGQLLGGGAIGTFATTKINKKIRKSQSYNGEG